MSLSPCTRPEGRPPQSRSCWCCMGKDNVNNKSSAVDYQILGLLEKAAPHTVDGAQLLVVYIDAQRLTQLLISLSAGALVQQYQQRPDREGRYHKVGVTFGHYHGDAIEEVESKLLWALRYAAQRLLIEVGAQSVFLTALRLKSCRRRQRLQIEANGKLWETLLSPGNGAE